MSYVHEAFREERTVSTVLWLPRSPDLSTYDFYLWDNLKAKVYSNNPHTNEELKTNIRHAIVEITPNELANVAGKTCWNVLSCVSKLMINSFSSSCKLLNVLHVVLNNNNLPCCTILYSVFTLNEWMFYMPLLRWSHCIITIISS